MIGILICQIALSIVLAAIFLIRPSLTSAAGWKIVAFIGLCVLPALCIVGGMNTHGFAFIAAILIGLGILVYLASLVFIVTPAAGNRN